MTKQERRAIKLVIQKLREVRETFSYGTVKYDEMTMCTVTLQCCIQESRTFDQKQLLKSL